MQTWHGAIHTQSRSATNGRHVQVSEQTLRALGVTRCADLLTSRGLLGALYSDVATDHFMAVGLGIGGTRHSQPPQEGEAGRKGMSVERTFSAISTRAQLEAKVRPPPPTRQQSGGTLRARSLDLRYHVRFVFVVPTADSVCKGLAGNTPSVH